MFKRRKATEPAMANLRPVHLIPRQAKEERPEPQTDPDEDANPLEGFDTDVITRKVVVSAEDAKRSTFEDKSTLLQNWKILVPVGAVAVLLTGAIAVLATRAKTPAPVIAPVIVSPPTPSRKEPPQPAPAPAPPKPVPEITPLREVIHLQISATPVETELSLDGNVLAGHRLNLDVPKDRGIHIVSASAPGYIPFNQQVSFSSDVVLEISLRPSPSSRARPVRSVARPRPEPESRPKLDARPKNDPSPTVVQPPPRPSFEPGMNIEGPPVRRNVKSIDEGNPYKS